MAKLRERMRARLRVTVMRIARLSLKGRVMELYVVTARM